MKLIDIYSSSHCNFYLWVSVNFRGTSDENPCVDSLGEAEHVDRADRVRLDRLHGVVHVVRGRGRRGKMVHLVDLSSP